MKFHADFDVPLATILREDTDGFLVITYSTSQVG